MVQTCFLY